MLSRRVKRRHMFVAQRLWSILFKNLSQNQRHMRETASYSCHQSKIQLRPLILISDFIAFSFHFFSWTEKYFILSERNASEGKHLNWLD